MSVSAIGASQVASTYSSERGEAPGADHDNDGDEAAATPAVQATPAPGTGTVVDKMA
ncbi:MAG: hypothetical protein JSR61_01290 [Proteobacteria bacterium]|nr:hypothetical protein [Pseudomonadota bacterium]